MFKTLIFGFRCWKFLLLFLDIEGFYFCSWMLKVLALTFKCWRFLLLDVEGLWFLVFCLFAFFFKNNVKTYSILFIVWLYKFSLTYNDEKFMKGDFLMIIVLHMSCFVFECLWWLLLFFCYRAELSLCFNPSISKLCIQGKIFSKVFKIVI